MYTPLRDVTVVERMMTIGMNVFYFSYKFVYGFQRYEMNVT